MPKIRPQKNKATTSLIFKCTKANSKAEIIIAPIGLYFIKSISISCFLKTISSKIGVKNTVPIKIKIRFISKSVILKTNIRSFLSFRPLINSLTSVKGSEIINMAEARTNKKNIVFNEGGWTDQSNLIPLCLLMYNINGTNPAVAAIMEQIVI